MSYIFGRHSPIDPSFRWKSHEFRVLDRQKSQKSPVTLQPQVTCSCGKAGAGAIFIKQVTGLKCRFPPSPVFDRPMGEGKHQFTTAGHDPLAFLSTSLDWRETRAGETDFEPIAPLR